MHQNSISFAGAGRVASALCNELYHSGFRIDLIVSLSETNGRALAESCNSEWSDELVFPQSTNVIIVAVPDRELEAVLGRITCAEETLVAHTAGSHGLGVFPGRYNKSGVFYPLQTFSKNRKISLAEVPFLLEASDDESLLVLRTLAEAVHGKVYLVDPDQRRMLHLAAVFVCNFTNHMLTLGKEISTKEGLSFEILTPLIKETVAKALDSGPENSQTGPAVRHDKNTIEKHLELLSFSPDLQKIYRELTLSIIEYYNNIDKAELRE